MFRIIDKLGGIEPVRDAIERREGRRPTLFAVRAWTTRRIIPTKSMLALMQECEARGIPFDSADFRDPRPLPPHRRKAS